MLQVCADCDNGLAIRCSTRGGMSARKGKGQSVCGHIRISLDSDGGYLSRKGGMKAPKCRLCKHEHWNNQPHVFASNTESASNNASNKAIPKRLQPQESRPVRGVRRGNDGPRQKVARALPESLENAGAWPITEDKAARVGRDGLSSKADVKQRWSREAYNAYQREYMRRWRAS